jgi:hypothetical protein
MERRLFETSGHYKSQNSFRNAFGDAVRLVVCIVGQLKQDCLRFHVTKCSSVQMNLLEVLLLIALAGETGLGM